MATPTCVADVWQYTFGIGEDSGQPVTPDYEPPFKFTGKIDTVVIGVAPADLSPADTETLRRAEVKARASSD
jgi:hypothetical protein